jgi:hypothetical protein
MTWTLVIAEGLSAAGWATMLLSVGFVSSLLGWCIWKVLTLPGSEEHLHSPADIHPPDQT